MRFSFREFSSSNFSKTLEVMEVKRENKYVEDQQDILDGVGF